MQIHPNIITIDTQIKMPLMMLPVRSVLVKTNSGVIFISPGPSTLDDAKKVATLGPVTDIVAPNLFHHLNIRKALELYPTAKLWGVQGFKEKRPNLKWDYIFETDAWKYNEELQAIHIHGIAKVNEVVFLHKKSKSLIVTDLCFNMQNVNGFGAWLILSLFGTYKKLGISKFMLKFVSDKTAFKKSIEDLMTLDFENVIVSHGENITGNAKELLKKAFQERGLL